MKIGIITYQANHLKTEQVIQALRFDRELELYMYALPFKPRAPRETLFNHRPDMSKGAYSADVAANYDIPYRRIESVDEINDMLDCCLIAGAGLLPASFVNRYQTINCHPGLIPAVRGLDSFKWAIYDGQPLGITLHYIDADIDSGDVFAHVKTPVYKSDTIEQLARRHYEFEIDILTRFRQFVEVPNVIENLPAGASHRRMKQEDEAKMLNRASDYIARYSKQNDMRRTA